MKLDVVSRDERDGGPRQLLNPRPHRRACDRDGHALPPLRHGEAVGLGLLAVLRLSGQDQLRDEVRELLAAMDLPVTMDPSIDRMPSSPPPARQEAPWRDVPYVVVDAPGQLRWGQEIDDAAVLAAVKELR